MHVGHALFLHLCLQLIRAHFRADDDVMIVGHWLVFISDQDSMQIHEFFNIDAFFLLLFEIKFAT